ncbi:hypothetical protein XENOCAPTIV_015558, partial [Xenoophorus captivus]
LEFRTKHTFFGCFVQMLCIGNASIITHNLPAINGYIHVINRVLAPSRSDLPPEPPTVMAFLNSSSSFSLFREYALYHVILNELLFPDHLHDGMLKSTLLGLDYQVQFHLTDKNQVLSTSFTEITPVALVSTATSALNAPETTGAHAPITGNARTTVSLCANINKRRDYSPHHRGMVCSHQNVAAPQPRETLAEPSVVTTFLAEAVAMVST